MKPGVLRPLEKTLGPGPLVLLCLVAGALSGTPRATAGQESADTLESGESSWFSGRHLWDPLRADPREPRTSLTYLSTTLFQTAASPEERPGFTLPEEGLARSSRQATAAFGVSLAAWEARFANGSRLEVGLQGGVFARFRLDSSSQDLVGSDWSIALPVTVRHGSYSARARFLHTSSHLGDEIAEATGAVPLSFAFEALELLVAKEIWSDRIRLYAGGGLVVRSQTYVATKDDRELTSNERYAQLGAEGRWVPWSARRFGLVAGLDWQRWDLTDWEDQLSAAVGVEFRSGSRRVGVLARAFHGPSQLGQFFLSEETFYGLEIRVDL